MNKQLATTALLLSLATLPALAGGIAIHSVALTDNGDADGYADTRETVEMRLTVQNTSGVALTGITLSIHAHNPALACVTDPDVTVGDLQPGELSQTDPFVFVVSDVDRTALGLGAYDTHSATFTVHADSQPARQPVHPERIVLDLDLDVSGGAGPTSYFETFEDNTLGSFEIDNIDAGKHSLAASDDYRCQYSDPDFPNSNSYGTFAADVCFLANSPLLADATWWKLSGPAFSPLGGRGFSGFHSLVFGVDLGPPLNWSTPMTVMEAVRSVDPIHLGWDGVSPQLSFMHQVSLIDSRTAALDDGEAYDRGVVMAQLADAAGQPAGPWIKIEPFQNVYTEVNAPFIFNCTFDPADDGSTEDDYYYPADPDRRYGPSSTCFPEKSYTFVGETANPFNAANVGGVDGPGMQGLWGIGTWIESRFDLSRFRGRSVRLRYLYTAVQAGSATDDLWQELFNLPPGYPGDDGWWIDDVTVDDALTAAALVTVDAKDNSSLPGGPAGDGDLDNVADLCDNCAMDANPDQSDLDFDGIGEICDHCPGDTANIDPDSDFVCDAADNCPLAPNPDQIDGDSDSFGLACDCNDGSAFVYPGAPERNDGLDNQCPGDAGYGATDELQPTAGFYDPNDLNRFSWSAQPGAVRYQVARGETALFSVGCTLLPQNPTTQTFISDAAIPPVGGGIFFYLAHAVTPNAGSWGLRSDGSERVVLCD